MQLNVQKSCLKIEEMFKIKINNLKSYEKIIFEF